MTSHIPVPLPREGAERLTPPGQAEVTLLGRGVLTAIRGPQGLTQLQGLLMAAAFEAMTGFAIDLEAHAISPEDFALGLSDRNVAFRRRMVQVMVLGALVLRPLPPEVSSNVGAFARALGVEEDMVEVVRRFSDGDFGLAAVDFQRNGYIADFAEHDQRALHTSRELQEAWADASDDEMLALRWESLETLNEGSLGRLVSELYRARGFVYPGRPGSAPPLLAQHDWVHVLAGYGTTVESELEVFAFIARANDDPRAFSLLAMVVSLFETGYLETGAGLFEAFPGQLSKDCVATRVADALRRGALVTGSVDFMATDWFELAPLSLEEVRAHFGVVDKSPAAIAAGSVSAFSPGGISEFQLAAGIEAAKLRSRPFDSFGAEIR